MKITRTINVITLTLILFLAGCFGLSDAAEAADEHEHTPNAAPVLHAELMYQSQSESNFSYAASCTSIDCNITSYHAAVDPDGDVLQMGYDYDLDGTIDNLLTSPRGFTEHQIPIADMFTNEVSSVQNTEFSACINGNKTLTTTTLVVDELMTSIALIAVDSKGAASAVLLNVNSLYNTEEVIVSEEIQTCDDYEFSARDATGSMGETTDDKLVHVQLTSGEPINWALLKVSIIVDGGSTLICGATDGSAAAEGDCAFMTDDSTTWDVAEEITIMENGQDLCDGTDGGCAVQVILTQIGVGNESDEIIGVISSFADSSA